MKNVANHYDTKFGWLCFGESHITCPCGKLSYHTTAILHITKLLCGKICTVRVENGYSWGKLLTELVLNTELI